MKKLRHWNGSMALRACLRSLIAFAASAASFSSRLGRKLAIKEITSRGQTPKWSLAPPQPEGSWFFCPPAALLRTVRDHKSICQPSRLAGRAKSLTTKAVKDLRQALSLFGLLLVVGLALFGPPLAPYQYDEVSAQQFAPPSSEHWMGTDIHGRDLFVRILHGARVSILVGLVGASVSVVIGVSYGLISGYIGGKVDASMMRFVDILYALPRMVLVIVLIALIDERLKDWLHGHAWIHLQESSRLILLFIALGCVEWLTMARIVRGQVLTLKTRAFVHAAQTLGQSPWRIMTRHLLPNLYGVILVYTTLTVPSVILEESFLSFLGLGVQAPRSSLGTLLAEGAIWINPVRIYWWLIVGPALCMAVTLLCLNFLGDALRDKLDPKQLI